MTKVLVFASYFEPAYLGGGPIQTLRAMIRSAPEKFCTRVICSNHDLGTRVPLVSTPDTWLPVNRASVKYIGSRPWKFFQSLVSTRSADLIYLNSFFGFKYSVLPQVLSCLGMWRSGTVLLAPRGELHPGALSSKSAKKTVFLMIYRALGFHRRVLWHASTELEARHIQQAFGTNVRVIVRENETSLPPMARIRASRRSGICRLIFASRLVSKKGLHTFLEALQNVASEVAVQIVGYFEDAEYEQRCVELASKIPTNVELQFTGSATHAELLRYLGLSDAMVFPTQGENFGHVIAEALSEACPVICSDQTPWTETLAGGGGRVVASLVTDDWSDAIEEFVASGRKYWDGKSKEAGCSYYRWRTVEKGPHAFELALAHGSSSRLPNRYRVGRSWTQSLD